MHSVTPHILQNIPLDLPAIGEVKVSIDKKEGVESSQVVSKEEDGGEDTVAVEGCVTPVGMSGNGAPVAVDVVVAIFRTESCVGLGRTNVGDADAAGILLHADVVVGLGRSMAPIDRVWSIVGNDLLILLKDGA